MSKFLFLLHTGDANFGALTPPEADALLAKFVDWTTSLAGRGHLVDVQRLKMEDGGRTVRRKRDEIVVDGPYAEAKELVHGLYVVEAADFDAAVQLAGECPLISLGGEIEVREIDTNFPAV